MNTVKGVMLIMLLLYPIVVCAQTYVTLEYDTRKTIEVHIENARQIKHNDCSWSVDGVVNITYQGYKSYTAYVDIVQKKYFEGDIDLKADYTWHYIDPYLSAESGPGNQKWTLRCKRITVQSLEGTTLSIGQKKTLKYTLSSTNHPSVTWSSNKPNVASVNESTGEITANSAGTATITLDTGWGGTKDCTVTVNAIPTTTSPTSISITYNNTFLANKYLPIQDVNKTIQLSYKLYPENAESSVTWNSSAPSIVSISNTGILQAKSFGTARITCTTSNGLQDYVDVNVYTPGNVDSDSEINVADLSSIVKYIRGKGTNANFNVKAADVNQDGVVNEEDLRIIEDMIMNN